MTKTGTIQLLTVLLLCSVLGLSVQVSINESDRELARYTERVKLVHKLLLSEKCPDLNIRVKRETQEGVNSKVLLEIEVALFNELTNRLVECRLVNQRKSLPAITSMPSTSTIETTTASPTTTRKPQPLACQQASNLDEAWRHESSPAEQKPINGSLNCDTRDMVSQGNPWFRFSGAAGSHLLDHCIPDYRCGTHVTLWSNATMPTDIGVATTIPLYASHVSKCDYSSYTCSVMRCSDKPHDLIYRWAGHSICYYGFCGMS